MWIKEPPVDIINKESSHYNLNLLFNQGKFFIMDNHLAAAWCWLNHLDPTENYNFFHIDQHPDLLCNAPMSSLEPLKENPKVSIEDYLALRYTSGERSAHVFRYDNYILQTKKIFPNWFSLCYFACPEHVHEEKLNIHYNASCYDLSTKISYWVHDGKEAGSTPYPQEKVHKWILNIDVDYFFMENKYQLFTDTYIIECCNDIKKRIEDIEIITIALSPECCGDWNNAYRIAKLMAREFELDFSIDGLE